MMTGGLQLAVGVQHNCSVQTVWDCNIAVNVDTGDRT